MNAANTTSIGLCRCIHVKCFGQFVSVCKGYLELHSLKRVQPFLSTKAQTLNAIDL